MRYSARWVQFLLCVCALVISSNVLAFRLQQARWNPATLPIQYRINVATAPASIGQAGARSALDAGMASWSAPACTNWRATNAGDTTLVANSSDGRNTFLFRSTSWPPELGDVNSTIGITTSVWNQGGYLFDSDIQYNDVGFDWSLNGARGTVDTQSIATHEEGHFLGLDHTSVSGAIMFPSYAGGVIRTLSQDDINGVCTLYPSGVMQPDAGVPTDPCSQYASCSGCTPVNGCGWCSSANRCLSGSETGPLSGSCASGWAWYPQQCTTTPPPDTGTMMNDPCNTQRSCDQCTPVNGCGWCSGNNTCMSGSQNGPTLAGCSGGWSWIPSECPGYVPGQQSFGEPCIEPMDCASGGYCIRDQSSSVPFCSRQCNDDCSCPRGYRCVATSTAGLNICIHGTNSCPMTTDSGVPPIDTGILPDVGNIIDVPPLPDIVAPIDTGSTTTDTGTSSDAGTTSDIGVDDASNNTDGARPDGGLRGAPLRGCGCRTPAQTPMKPGITLVLFGLAVIAANRARKR